MLQTQQDFDATPYGGATPKALSELEKKKNPKLFFASVVTYRDL